MFEPIKDKEAELRDLAENRAMKGMVENLAREPLPPGIFEYEEVSRFFRFASWVIGGTIAGALLINLIFKITIG